MEDITLRQTGRTTRMIESLPDRPTEKLYLVAFNQHLATHLRNVIREVKGPNYPQDMIEPRSVKNISQWGTGIWHDRFYFDHTVWDYFSDLTKEDQDFMIMLTSDIQLGEFFQVGQHAPKKEAGGWFANLRKKVASWILPS